MAWSQQSNSTYNIGKTEAMFPIPTKNQRQIRPPVLRMEEVLIRTDNALKYLRVSFDRR